MPTPLDQTRPVRWGILGAGRIAATVGADIQDSPDSEIVAIGSRDVGRATDLAGRLNLADAARSYGSYDELAADPDVDVIYVATTHGQHHHDALLALRAGKPLLVEKAFTLDEATGREVFDEAREQDLFCMEAMWMRCNPVVRQAQQLVADGRIGRVLSVSADHGQSFPFDPQNRLYDLSVGGGALLDLGVYSATFAWLFLGQPETVATTGSLSPTGSDVTTAMQWGYADGRFASVSCTTRSATPCEGLVVGTQGWLRLSGPFYYPDRLELHVGDQTEVSGAKLAGNGYGPQVAEVERCLRAGEIESSLVPWADTLGILAVMDAARANLGVRYPGDE
ncbi:MAG: Gfo/Idh/MocA family oxidoreductase [bacterium]